jgi:hypothetical protein
MSRHIFRKDERLMRDKYKDHNADVVVVDDAAVG